MDKVDITLQLILAAMKCLPTTHKNVLWIPRIGTLQMKWCYSLLCFESHLFLFLKSLLLVSSEHLNTSLHQIGNCWYFIRWSAEAYCIFSRTLQWPSGEIKGRLTETIELKSVLSESLTTAVMNIVRETANAKPSKWKSKCNTQQVKEQM